MSKTPLLLPRHYWYKDRMMDCIEALNRAEHAEDWDAFKSQAKELARELLYIATEWDKYYKEGH